MLATSRVNLARDPFGRDIDFLGDIGAVEQQRVGAGLTLDRVAAIARIPDECVVASAEKGNVVAAPAVDKIVARAAGDRVITVAAVEREVDLAGVQLGRIDHVVSGKAVDHQRVLAGFGAADSHLCRQAVDHHVSAAADHADLVVAGGAVDDHGVRLTVALAASRRRR